MNPSDKLQERIGAAVGLLVVGALVGLAIIQGIVWAVLVIRTGQMQPMAVSFPEALLAMASLIVGFYYGAKVGTVQLNGSVAKLADGAQQMAKALQGTAAPAAIGQAPADPPDQAAA